MGLKEFTTVPADIRDWGRWMRAQFQNGEVGTDGIADNAIGNAELRDSAALSVIGRPVNSIGDPADIAAASDGQVLRRSGTTLGFGTVATAGITANAADNTILADMAQDTIKGRTSGAGTGDPVDLTAAQVATIVSAAVASALNITTGSYTPTLTNVTNIAASSASLFRYLRIGTMVVAYGRLTITPTAAAAASELGVSLPIASALTANEQVGGAAISVSIVSECAAIRADGPNDRARLSWVTTTNVLNGYAALFMYEIL